MGTGGFAFSEVWETPKCESWKGQWNLHSPDFPFFTQGDWDSEGGGLWTKVTLQSGWVFLWGWEEGRGVGVLGAYKRWRGTEELYHQLGYGWTWILRPLGNWNWPLSPGSLSPTTQPQKTLPTFSRWDRNLLPALSGLGICRVISKAVSGPWAGFKAILEGKAAAALRLCGHATVCLSLWPAPSCEPVCGLLWWCLHMCLCELNRHRWMEGEQCTINERWCLI